MMLNRFIEFIICLIITTSFSANAKKLLAVTVATSNNDALQRYTRSAEVNGIKTQVFGLNEKWEGGDMERGLGGAQKINILKSALPTIEDPEDTIVLFSDSYDVIINDDEETILKKFHDINANIVFGAEDFCWPDIKLVDKYPKVSDKQKRYLNSGGFIGYANDIMAILNVKSVKNDDDDQLYYTNIYLDKSLRDSHKIKLDSDAVIFQNLHGVLKEVSIKYINGKSKLYNSRTSTYPSVIHGNGPIKVQFNNMANYLAKSWSQADGCTACKENRLSLKGKSDEELPLIQVSVMVTNAVPFISRFLDRLSKQDYPKSRIMMTFYPQGDVYSIDINNFIEKHKEEYYGVEIMSASSKVYDTFSARYNAINHCMSIEECSYVMLIEGVSQLTNTATIRTMMENNRGVVGPKLTRRGKLWSNFWGLVGKDGFYERSDDYIDIVENVKRGIWNVPYLSGCIFINRNKFSDILKSMKEEKAKKTFTVINGDIHFSKALRQSHVFMWLDNTVDFGYLTNDADVKTTHLHNDLWQIFDNPLDWEEVYVNPLYEQYKSNKKQMHDFPQPCPDVFWFPLMSEQFCKEIVEEMEFFGEWSNGSNNDSRLEGGYENVPTRDIHMRQIEWEPHWIHVLRKYVGPVQRKLYLGHEDEPWARMNFIVRYKPDEQPSLRPHHDASSYTINMALNRAGIDYQGGGARFIRYDCAVKDTKVGWTLIHPGRVTHYHEGLKTTNGTRYIFVTFINP